MRLIGEGILQSPNWEDVFFLPTNSHALYEAAQNWTMEYWINNPALETKSADDALILAALEEKHNG